MCIPYRCLHSIYSLLKSNIILLLLLSEACVYRKMALETISHIKIKRSHTETVQHTECLLTENVLSARARTRERELQENLLKFCAIRIFLCSGVVMAILHKTYTHTWEMSGAASIVALRAPIMCIRACPVAMQFSLYFELMRLRHFSSARLRICGVFYTQSGVRMYRAYKELLLRWRHTGGDGLTKLERARAGRVYCGLRKPSASRSLRITKGRNKRHKTKHTQKRRPNDKNTRSACEARTRLYGDEVWNMSGFSYVCVCVCEVILICLIGV